jgi:hypothetical protein
MIPQVFDKRPPFVRFEEREMGIDQAASDEAGRPIPRVIVMACITPHGSKDVVEKPAVEWIEQIHQKAMRGEYNPEWVQHFRAALQEWQRGNELPREGTPVKTWQPITREASNRLIALGITTVEDLAAFPDSGLGGIGMDGRYLRDLARGWINEAKDKGINAKALADANVEIDRLKAQNESLQARMARLEAQQPQRAGRRRTMNDAEDDAA